MKFSLGIILINLHLLVVTQTNAQTSADSAAIRTILQEEVTSWNSGDAATYSKQFAENGTFTNIRGMFAIGYQRFLDRHVEIFNGIFAKTILEQDVVSFRFITPEVAIVETLTWIRGFPKDRSPKGVHIDEQGRLHTRLLQVFEKQKGEWRIIVYHNVDVKADSPVPAHR